MKVNRTKLMVQMARQGLNQKKLAAISGVSRQTISSLLNGKNCYPVTLHALASALHIDVSDILDNSPHCNEGIPPQERSLHMIEIPEFTRDDFLLTDEPYRFIEENSLNPLQREQLVQRIQVIAESVNVPNFHSLWRAFLQMTDPSSQAAPHHTLRECQGGCTGKCLI